MFIIRLSCSIYSTDMMQTKCTTSFRHTDRLARAFSLFSSLYRHQYTMRKMFHSKCITQEGHIKCTQLTSKVRMRVNYYRNLSTLEKGKLMFITIESASISTTEYSTFVYFVLSQALSAHFEF